MCHCLEQAVPYPRLALLVPSSGTRSNSPDHARLFRRYSPTARNTGCPPCDSSSSGLIFPLVFILGGGGTLFFGSETWKCARESDTWPTAQAVVKSATIDQHRSPRTDGRPEDVTYHAAIFYQFTVDGKTHAGHNVAFGDYGSNYRDHAQSIVNEYPKGKAVAVYVFAWATGMSVPGNRASRGRRGSCPALASSSCLSGSSWPSSCPS